MRKSSVIYLMLGAAILTSLVGCAPSGYQVKAPISSSLRYEVNPQAGKNVFGMVDKRAESERIFSSGRLPATLSIDGVEIDPPKLLAQSLQQELAARGLPDAVLQGAQISPRIELRTFNILNHRTNGFTPFISLTFLSVDLDSGADKKRIGVFIKRGKVPVWSFEEVVEPTFNQPISLAIKELAAKLVNHYHGYKASDAAVEEQIRKVNVRSGEDDYINVYALGFSNNPKAIDVMVKLSKDQDEYVRLAAISSLGTLRATGQFDLLSSIYRGRENIWQDRAMALKAIGDLGTPEAKKMLADELKFWDGQPRENEAIWTSQVIRLYL